MFDQIETKINPSVSDSARNVLQEEAMKSSGKSDSFASAAESKSQPPLASDAQKASTVSASAIAQLKAEEAKAFKNLYEKNNFELDPVKKGEDPLQSLELMQKEGKIKMSQEQMQAEAKRIEQRDAEDSGPSHTNTADHIMFWSEKEIDQQVQALVDKPQGIDVSNHQGWINWQQVKDAGMQFAYMKATEGTGYVDPYFDGNRKGAQDAGLRVGYYHYFHPEQSVADQVNLFCDTVGKVEPGALRLEIDAEDPSLWSPYTTEQRVKMIDDFCQGVKNRTGVTPELILYCNPSFADDLLGNSPALNKYPLFIANYGVDQPTVPDPWTKWDFWQYSETGAVPGINGHVDMDVFNGTADDLNKYPIASTISQRGAREQGNGPIGNKASDGLMAQRAIERTKA